MNWLKKNLTYIMTLLSVVGYMTSCTEETTDEPTDLLNHDWMFYLGDNPVAFLADFDDHDWRHVDLPHDWSVEGEFMEDKSGDWSRGVLPTGAGWYRKSVELSKEDLDGSIYLQIDGISANGSVYVNGALAGRRSPGAFTSSATDVKKYMHPGKNTIAIHVNNEEQPSSRYYTGSGIHRNVWLRKTNALHVPPYGVSIETPLVHETKASIRAKTDVRNNNKYGLDVLVTTVVYDQKGIEVVRDSKTVHVEGESTLKVQQDLRLKTPNLWSVDNPYLYQAKTTLSARGEKKSEETTTFGVRSFYFDSETGFILNDVPTKIQGVCMHQDLGCLGMAMNERAMEKRLQMLKEMGCNAIRWAHDPPAPEYLDMCDRMGFLVIDEAFDVWMLSKSKYDYAKDFNDWGEADVATMVMRDRNHPSVIMWSIGNEVVEQWADPATADDNTARKPNDFQSGMVPNHEETEDGMEMTNTSMMKCRILAEIVRRLDKSRPVTAALNDMSKNNNLLKAQALDVIGINYNNEAWDNLKEAIPGKALVITESTSALATRGYYKMSSTHTYIYPESMLKPQKDASLSCSSYDNCHTPWGSSHEMTLRQLEELPNFCGQFVWSGYDYLGESTPYAWPARSSFFGLVDMAGFPKDAYYLYQSEWQTEKTVLHLFPHWNWTTGDEVDLWCYYNNADEVELFVNGKSRGVRKKTAARRHAIWRVQYEPGEVRVVSRKEGKVVQEAAMSTAGRPYKLVVKADRNKIHADGKDLSFLTIEVQDRYGNLVPTAQNEVGIHVEGTGYIAGLDNGSQFSTQKFQSDSIRAFYGKCMAVIRSNGKPGNVRIIVDSEGLEDAETTIHCLSPTVY